MDKESASFLQGQTKLCSLYWHNINNICSRNYSLTVNRNGTDITFRADAPAYMKFSF